MRDFDATATWVARLFGWRVRWSGAAMNQDYTVHVGDDDRYVALYQPGRPLTPGGANYTTIGGFNHQAVVVNDLDAFEDRMKAEGF